MTTAIAAGVVLVAPGVAHAADTTIRLSADKMRTALKAVSETSTAATRRGWKAVLSTTDNSQQSVRGSYTVDRADGIVSLQVRAGAKRISAYVVAGKGMYSSFDGANIQAAMKMIGRPAVRYTFMPEPPELEHYIKGNIPAPTSILTEDVHRAGTRTTHDDGSTDYRVTAANGGTVTLHVDPAGRLTKVRGSVTGAPFALALQYGPQRVTLPAARVTVDAKTLTNAVAYLDMPNAVKTAANNGALETRRAADGKKVEVSALRTLTRRAAAAVARSSLVKLTTDNIDNGVRISARNPWTKETMTYTVIAGGRDVLVKQV
jgi:hypothetical protein